MCVSYITMVAYITPCVTIVSSGRPTPGAFKPMIFFGLSPE